MMQVKKRLDNKEEGNSINDDQIVEEDDNREQRNIFIQKLVEAEYSEIMAARAFDNVDPDDITQGFSFIFCIMF